YWASKYLSPRLRQMFGTDNIEELFAGEVERVCHRNARQWSILSLGSGECSSEIDVAKRLLKRGADFVMVCTDLSPEMLAVGRQNAAQSGVGRILSSVEADINREFPKGNWDVIIANHCLHHFVELEYIFDSIRDQIGGSGALITSHMIGRNG